MRKFLFVLVVVFTGCSQQAYDPSRVLSGAEEAAWVRRLAVYVDTRPNDIKPADRFLGRYKGYYDSLVVRHESKLAAFHQEGDLYYYLYHKKDVKSMYEHYRYVGGVCKLDAQGNISWLDQRFYSPRLTAEEMDRGAELFRSMVETQDISAFIGNFDYVEWPDADFIYSPEKQEWVLQDTSRLRGIAPMIHE